MGYRFFSEYQGKGYATISANAVKEHFFSVLNGKKLKTRCYKQNVKSHALIERLGFKMTSQSATHYYFEMER
jgi:RimJ/RimL family protein N-acetyltransferase